MKRSQVTQGATMIIVVLFTLLLLAGILAATVRLGLGSRQNTADQAATLRAQYAAESGISAVRSRFRDYQNILKANTTDAAGTSVAQLQMPSGTVKETVISDAKAFCGKSAVANPWTPTSEFAMKNDPLRPGDPDALPDAQQCVAVTAAPTANSYSIMADAVRPVAYTRLPTAERPAAGASRATLQNWWLSALNDVTLGNVKYDVRPLRVVRLTEYRYRFYLGASRVQVKGATGGGERYLAASRTGDGDWWFEILVPNPFDNVLFVNRWLSDDGGFYDDVIDGDFFSNQKVRMLFAVNRTVFKGKVKSAGCTTFPPANSELGTDCTKADGAGFYGAYTALVKPTAAAVAGGINAINTNLKDKLTAQGTTFTATGSNDVSFTESYQPLPINSTNQQQQAAESGLELAPNETGVELVAGDANGNPLTTYNADQSAWSEPTPTYQYIRLKTANSTTYAAAWLEVDKATYDTWPAVQRGTFTSSGKTLYRIHPKVNDTGREFRFGPDKVLYQKGDTGWVSTGRTFNGVIYEDGDVNVSGPYRKDGSMTADVSKMPPALASFAKINVTASQKITLDTDLTMSNTPCNNGNTQAGCPKNDGAEPTNALVLFTPNKDITMSRFTQQDATYHAAIMASQGAFNVENYNSRRVQGARHVIGSVVEDRYGLNGVANLSNNTVTYVNGYGDDFSFDNRLKKDILPASPIVQIWQGADASSTPKRLEDLTWKQVGAGGY